jgi:hypothetical protein
MEDQLKRLLTQLQDIEDMKADMDDEEYSTTRQETMDQLQEFEVSLNKMAAGNMSLVDSIGSVQLAIQAAIRSSTSPEILNMFLKKENGALRTRLAGLDSDRILGRITLDAYNSQATEIVKMLDKLGEPLNPKEQELLMKVRYVPYTSKSRPNKLSPFIAVEQDKESMGGYTKASSEVGT